MTDPKWIPDEQELLKVTSFVIRRSTKGETEVLVFQHPNAGVQFPAGTVDPGEDPTQAALREATEETGLSGFSGIRLVGEQSERLPDPNLAVVRTTPLFFRPDEASTSWAQIRRGIVVRCRRRDAGFVQVTYEEFDRFPDPQYVTTELTGWVPADALATSRRRLFYVITHDAPSEPRWRHRADQNDLVVFWAATTSLPTIVSPQDRWIPYLLDSIKS
jgi:8-oxo-dGTP pyrophosphatase MutT (NUDIX family)